MVCLFQPQRKESADCFRTRGQVRLLPAPFIKSRDQFLGKSHLKTLGEGGWFGHVWNIRKFRLTRKALEVT